MISRYWPNSAWFRSGYAFPAPSTLTGTNPTTPMNTIWQKSHLTCYEVWGPIPGITQAEVDRQIAALNNPANAFPYQDLYNVQAGPDGTLSFQNPAGRFVVAESKPLWTTASPDTCYPPTATRAGTTRMETVGNLSSKAKTC